MSAGIVLSIGTILQRTGLPRFRVLRRHRVDPSPRGREVRLQLVYEAETAPGAALTVGSFLRPNPDHDP